MKKLIFIFAITFKITFSQTIFTENYDEYFKKYSKRYFGPTFDWKIFKAQAFAESNLDPSATSWVGAKGLMQLMPETYREVQLKNPEFEDIGDPRWNIAAGIFYNKRLYKQLNDKLNERDKFNFVFGSYNAGLGTIRRAEKIAFENNLDLNKWESIELIASKVPKWRHEETLGYVKKIDKYYTKLKIKTKRKG